MRRKGIVLKLGLLIMVLFLSILIPFAFLIDRIFLNVYSIYLNDNVKSLAQSLEVEWIEKNQSPEEIYHHLNLFFEHEVIFLNQNGHITHGNIMEFNEGNHLPDEWIAQLQNGETVEGERYNSDTEENFYYFVEPIFNDEAFEGES
ncbi:hypothetical protein CW734_16115 [Planococcus sp. MB-3u-03]|uniref:hypothetical protein n=1 Tax=Planococcus sp. MB-3u-03 TaxID=2058136 RepID=UPI000C349D27|nr:hypothetical protein [Planococcus sp. MB-3u-03]AUD14915.1 hypothetical protein CW734_16115 [Planococcus sp. MB-3u-03]